MGELNARDTGWKPGTASYANAQVSELQLCLGSSFSTVPGRLSYNPLLFSLEKKSFHQ